MADRKKKRAYLDDFEKDLNGNYQYRGAHYHYKGTKSARPGTGRALGACAAVGLRWLAGGGPGARRDRAMRRSGCCCLTWRACWRRCMRVYLLVRLTAAGEPLRAYIHEQTVLKLPGSCTLAAVLAGITAAAQLVQLAVSRQNLPARILFILLQAAAAGAFAMENHQFKALKYEKQE